MALTPALDNDMCDRSGFFIHLDNPIHIGESSDGCIVPPNYTILVALNEWVKIDNQLQVIA
jgi:deoxycytidine triphosphate deaminase